MIKQITHNAAEKMINLGDVVIVDVRDIDNYNQGHIEGAVHLSVANFQQFCDITDKQKKIILYCYHGITSQAVAQHLLNHGFIKAYSLIGGFATWKEHHAISTKGK